jgi:hypothetical protein
MSMSILFFGVLGFFMLVTIIKSCMPNKGAREKREMEIAEKERKDRHQTFLNFLEEKNMNLDDIDSCILAIAARESVFHAIVFYMEEKSVGLSESKKYVDKLCLSNGVSDQITTRIGHQSLVMAATTAL